MSQYYIETRDVRDRYSRDEEPNFAMTFGKKFKCLRTGEPRHFQFKPHQQFVINHALKMVKDPLEIRRGLLLYHTLGLGKTCTSIGMADKLLSTGKFDGVIFLSPAGLRDNFIQEYCEKCGFEYLKQFSHKFSFFSYNYTGVIAQSEFPSNFRRIIFIIDEIHNLIASTVNRSAILTEIYSRIYSAEYSFIIGLSGTPIYRSPREIFFLSALLYKQPNNPFHTWDSDAFDPKEFAKFLPISETSEQLTNQELLQTYMVKSLSGIVSYVSTENSQHYPKIAKNVVCLTPMSKYAHKSYEHEFTKELEILKLDKCKSVDVNYELDLSGKEDESKGSKAICYLASIKFFSSRICNISYPEEISHLNTFPYELRTKFRLNQLIDFVYGTATKRFDREVIHVPIELSESIHLPDGRRDIDDLFGKLKNFNLNPGYYLSDEELSQQSKIYLNNLPKTQDNSIYRYLDMEKLRTTYSPKFYQLIENIRNNEGKHAVFCHYKVTSGVYLISALLTMLGINNYIYSGDTGVKERHQYLKQFNDPANLTGEQVKVILLTDAGTEGLTLTATEHIHIVSPKHNQTKINQVIGRIRRLHSHDLLPPERQFVNIYYYLTTFNPEFFFQEIPNIDMNEVKSSIDVMKYFQFLKSPYPIDLSISDYVNNSHQDSSDVILYTRALEQDYFVRQAMRYLQLASIEQSSQLLTANESSLVDQLSDEFSESDLELMKQPTTELSNQEAKRQQKLIKRFRELTEITINNQQRWHLFEQTLLAKASQTESHSQIVSD